MFNFAGKSVHGAKRTVTELDLLAFWKSVDESYFLPLAPRCLETKRKELLDSLPRFDPSHDRGALLFITAEIDSDILSELRSELQQRNFVHYSDYLAQENTLSGSATADPTGAGTGREGHANTICGYSVLALVQDDGIAPPRRNLGLAEVEQRVLVRLQALKAQNKRDIKRFR